MRSTKARFVFSNDIFQFPGEVPRALLVVPELTVQDARIERGRCAIKRIQAWGGCVSDNGTEKGGHTANGVEEGHMARKGPKL